ncbi:MAG: type II secretion system protein [Elusimicrobiota bacterium]|nr:type II secretion system protein [Elusimicrobiota bacterium]
MKNNKKGFTLIELLVVVLIMGILASVGMPAYFKTVETSKARDAVAMGHMLGNAYRMFRVDNPTVALSGQITDGCGSFTCATVGANAACRLVACNYVAQHNWSQSSYTYNIGGGPAVTVDRNGGTYDAWGYVFNMTGGCAVVGGAPACPAF